VAALDDSRRQAAVSAALRSALTPNRSCTATVDVFFNQALTQGKAEPTLYMFKSEVLSLQFSVSASSVPDLTSLRRGFLFVNAISCCLRPDVISRHRKNNPLRQLQMCIYRS